MARSSEQPLATDWGPLEGRVWLNTAHQGRLAPAAGDAAREAVRWKEQPFELTVDRFSGVPATLRASLAALVEAAEDEIVLANSASYGLHLMANGIPLAAGDEVLLMHGDFPSNLWPWLGLESRGIHVRRLRPAGLVLQPDELAAAITPSTRVVCTSWVHSFSGQLFDIEAIGSICRAHGVRYVVNGSQCVGARPTPVHRLPIDALISVGFKWLCGPYGTGFCWVHPELLRSLEVNQRYWLSMQTSDDLGDDSDDLIERAVEGGRRFDIFGTANFFNYAPWRVSVDLVRQCGLEAIDHHDQKLVQRLIDGLDRRRYRLLSSESPAQRSTLVLIRHSEAERTEAIHRGLTARKLHVSFRRGALRAAPHLYNSEAEIDQLLEALDQLGR